MEVNKYDLQQIGRRASDEDLDYLWIRKRTGAWGFQEMEQVAQKWEESLRGEEFTALRDTDAQTFNSTTRMDRDGELRYIARIDDSIKWECVNEYEANRFTGVLLLPEKHDPGGKICCAQFRRGRRDLRKIWMTIEEAYAVLNLMLDGATLLSAVTETRNGKNRLGRAISNTLDVR